LRKAAIVSIFAAVSALFCASIQAQEPFRLDATQSFGFSTTYSPDSSHILIGDAEQRRIWTLGVEYTHLLHQGHRFRFDYEGSIMPLYEETDPFESGTTFTVEGQKVTLPQTPERLIYAIRGPVGTFLSPGGSTEPVYALLGREDTYAAAFAPLGARVSAFPSRRIQPTFSLDLGFVVSARDLPIEDSSWFNFMFSFGPGVQFFTSPNASLRLEYLYRHASNAGLGDQNPGVDQGVTRITLSRRW
jgi:opacity protein-like surface antigen